MKRNVFRHHTYILRKSGFKITPRRKAVIECMSRESRYYSPSEIWEELKESFKRLGLPSIYRILEEFESAGIVCRILREDRQLYYFLCNAETGHHHHFICRECRGVSEVGRCFAGQLYGMLEEELGCRPESHFMQIEGVCSECRTG